MLLNPSSADETADDQTVRRCMGFAQRDGHDGLEVVNLYAYVATNPDDLRRAGYLVGPDNDEHIAAAARECDYEFTRGSDGRHLCGARS